MSESSFDEVAAAIVAGVEKYVENPQVLCGTLVDDTILANIERYRGLADPAWQAAA